MWGGGQGGQGGRGGSGGSGGVNIGALTYTGGRGVNICALGVNICALTSASRELCVA